MSRKNALDAVVVELGKVLLSGVLKADESASEEQAQAVLEAPSMEVDDIDSEAEQVKESSASGKLLNPSARPFLPHSTSLLQTATQQLRAQSSSSLSKLLMTPSISG